MLALNQYKIANPTLLARIPEEQLTSLLRGYGYEPHFVIGDDPSLVHQQFAATLDTCLDRLAARREGTPTLWPMIVLRTPKGWGCPPVVDGQVVEGTFRAHQVPLPSRARTTSTAASSRRGCGRTGRRSCSTTTADQCPPRRSPAEG